jgi:hypothetical protein
VPIFAESSLIKVEFVYLYIKPYNFQPLNKNKFSTDKDLAVCAMKLEFLFNRMCIKIIYRIPSVKFQLFVNG